MKYHANTFAHMDVLELPDHLNIDHFPPVLLYDYHSREKISKQKIVLNYNTFSLLINGTKEVLCDDLSIGIDNSKFLLMKSGHFLMTEKLSESKDYRSVLMFFNNEMLMRFVSHNELTDKSTKNQSVHSFEYDAFIRQFTKSLLQISKLSLSTQEKLLKIKLEEILLYLIEKHGSDFIYSLMVNQSDYIHKFRRIVETNKLNKLTVAELAFLCNMSESTFKRLFKKTYSESPGNWFRNKRLEYAHHLLHQGQKKPSEIYHEVGFENLSSFVQAYKSKYTTTPKQHREI